MLDDHFFKTSSHLCLRDLISLSLTCKSFYNRLEGTRWFTRLKYTTLINEISQLINTHEANDTHKYIFQYHGIGTKFRIEAIIGYSYTFIHKISDSPYSTVHKTKFITKFGLLYKCYDMYLTNLDFLTTVLYPLHKSFTFQIKNIIHF